MLWDLDDTESIYETLEVTRSGYNRLPVKIDIGHQIQGHYHCSDEPNQIISLSLFFFAHAKAICVVICEIRPSCHEIRALLFK